MPALVYPLLGTSRDLAVGTMAVGSMLFASMLGPAVRDDPATYARLAFTATFFAGAFQAALGVLRLGFVVDLLSHSAILGFMGGAATVVCAQQLRGFLGVRHATHATGIVAIVRALLQQSHQVHCILHARHMLAMRHACSLYVSN